MRQPYVRHRGSGLAATERTGLGCGALALIGAGMLALTSPSALAAQPRSANPDAAYPARPIRFLMTAQRLVQELPTFIEIT